MFTEHAVLYLETKLTTIKIEQNYKENVPSLSTTYSATKSAQ